MLALLATTCALLGSGSMTAPDLGCTPGAYEHLTRKQACVHKERPSLPPADRRKILAQYGIDHWSGKDGELDHVVPFFLGGRTEEDNIFPERGKIPNPKDKVEAYVYRRVCLSKPQRMSVRTARRLFLRDWRIAWRKYIR